LVDETFDVGVAGEFAVDDRQVNYADAEMNIASHRARTAFLAPRLSPWRSPVRDL